MDQAFAIWRRVGGRATPMAESARVAPGRGAERSRKRLPSCSTCVSVSESRSAIPAGQEARAPVAVEENGQDHLVQVRPVILGEAAPPQRLTACAFEIEARRVHEHDVERGEQIAPAGEQFLLHNVLHAAPRERRGGVLLVFGKLLAEPSDGAIKMMQFEPLDPFDTIILTPAVGGAVRAATEQAVQHGQERRALRREIMLARVRQAFDHAPAARLLPHPLEGERRTDAPGAIVVASPRSNASSTIALSAKRAP